MNRLLLQPGAVVLALVLALLGGCATEKHAKESRRALDDYYTGNYTSARMGLRPLAEKTDEDYVLNNVRLGSASLVDYALEEAESAFYRAYEVINSTGVNNASRSTAAVLLDEKLKVWKGEPFERAMTNFYLGLVYYMQHDHANARAAFENALFKLRDYGEKKSEKGDEYREVESDFVVAYIMLAKAWQKLGNDEKAADLYRRVAMLRPDLRPLVERAQHGQTNVLLVIDYGYGPRKTWHHDNSIVAFEPEPRMAGPIARPLVRVDGKPLDLENADAAPIDLLSLAQDRRWQSIDTIRLTKSVVGTGLMAAGAYEANRRDGKDGTAAALFLAGALLKATATGDVRHWETLPRTVFLLPLRLTPGKHDVTVSFPDGSQTWHGLVCPDPQKGEEATYYMRLMRATTGPYRWPPPSWVGHEPPPQAPVPEVPAGTISGPRAER